MQLEFRILGDRQNTVDQISSSSPKRHNRDSSEFGKIVCSADQLKDKNIITISEEAEYDGKVSEMNIQVQWQEANATPKDSIAKAGPLFVREKGEGAFKQAECKLLSDGKIGWIYQDASLSGNFHVSKDTNISVKNLPDNHGEKQIIIEVVGEKNGDTSRKIHLRHGSGHTESSACQSWASA